MVQHLIQLDKTLMFYCISLQLFLCFCSVIALYLDFVVFHFQLNEYKLFQFKKKNHQLYACHFVTWNLTLSIILIMQTIVNTNSSNHGFLLQSHTPISINNITVIYFIWEQTYHNKALNFSPKKNIKFMPQYIFIYFIWEQTYHNKALNFSQKKALNSYLITFLYILFRI